MMNFPTNISTYFILVPLHIIKNKGSETTVEARYFRRNILSCDVNLHGVVLGEVDPRGNGRLLIEEFFISYLLHQLANINRK